MNIDPLSALHARLLRGDSATLALTDWCRAHGDTNARISARHAAQAEKSATMAQRARLQAAPDETIAYRRVQLCCMGHILVEAENWYVPGRLDEHMRRQLAQTDCPYGAVVAPLMPVRRTLASTFSPEGDPLIYMHALVLAPDGVVLAEVTERFTRAILQLGDARKTMPEVR